VRIKEQETRLTLYEHDDDDEYCKFNLKYIKLQIKSSRLLCKAGSNFDTMRSVTS